ncbi:glycoside hydrolase family 5 protein [Collybiopsis luxurians FD-317 M1]|uniref:Glycoside hydrolase family 5 protein n=1 Tax=Collybiopsis luxurians FD-317 M1 TaxID=944289 RepID=A0A0D0BTP8_9AGAR|nr:glycoside hydrolase family 5 protein [Collybiopsis luxurians FD-317 M1]
MENFISGFPGCEFHIREALPKAIGADKANLFFEKFLDSFFAEADVKFFKSLGLNCVRIAVNYHHFEDDMNPRVLKPEAFKQLDRVVSICADEGVYTIIDLHSVPGGQSGGWHADAGTHFGGFWKHKDFQDRFVWLWTKICERYKDNVWVAGYNLMNEPADPHPTHEGLLNIYDRTIAAIREIDTNHVLFLDGNTFATDFTKFPEDPLKRWGGGNIAFAIHDYSVFGFPNSPEVYTGSEEQKGKMYAAYVRKRRWMDERGLCVWNGEWGPVYARREYDGEGQTGEINRRRYGVLRDQLEMYRKDSLSWSIWLYKDIGFQGMVYVSQDTPYMNHFRSFLLKKHHLAVDAWGADDKHVKHIYDPIIHLLKEEIPESNRKLYPPIWSLENRATRISRTILVAEFLVQEWAEMFVGLGEEEIVELAESFRFERCENREELNEILKRNAGSMS